MAKINEVVRGLLRYGHYITDETFDADGHSVRVRLIDCNGCAGITDITGRRAAPAGHGNGGTNR